MQIRAGYEISYECPQPTPMILQLSVHSSRVGDLVTQDRIHMDPTIPVNTYHDAFGNFCHVITAPAGRTTFSADFIVWDSGQHDDVAPHAEQHALQDLPVDVLVYLLGSRYCETDKLSNTAWSLFGGGGCELNRSGDSRNFCLGGAALTYEVVKGLHLGGEIFHQTADTAGG